MYDVCIVTTIHGGFDNRIYQRQLNALADAGLSVCIIAPWDFSKRKRTDFDFVQTKMPETRGGRVMHGFRTFRAALRVSAKVYIFHDPDFLLFGWLLSHTRARPVIYDCHENIPEDILYGKDWIPTILRGPISVAFRFFEDRVVRGLHHAIVSVPHLYRRFEKQGAETALVRNFPRFQAHDGFKLERAVLYTGDLTRDYGIFNLLDIGREMKRRNMTVPLRIVDRFREDDRMRQLVRKTIADEELGMEILDSVVAEEMPTILARGCIGLSPIPDLPNKRLALPTKIFEYFMFGLAVIASDIAGTREVLEEGRLGILAKPGDAPAWVDHIERLLGEPEYFNHYVQAAREAVRSNYNWSHEERNLVAYVRKLTAESEGVQSISRSPSGVSS